MTVDVEDWFHILGDGEIGISEWDSLESRVEANTLALLRLFRSYGCQATFFVLGWVAERFPNLVRAIAEEGHEIASHGYNHQLLFDISPEEFRLDVSRSRQLLEELSGGPVLGYRAPGFSVTRETTWALAILKEEGYTYDASVFPASRNHGGIRGEIDEPHRRRIGEDTIIEVPVSMARLAGAKVPFSGGGYLRLTPKPLLSKLVRSTNARGVPTMIYVHPREIDVDQPRMNHLSFLRRFMYYHGQSTTHEKLATLLQRFSFTTIASFLQESQMLRAQP